MNSKIKENYQLNSILDIYEAGSNQTTDTALNYYINHNVIPDGVILSDKVIPVNGMHSIKNALLYDKNTSIENLEYSPLYSYSYYNLKPNSYNFYKLISAKDIDYENAYLKYAHLSNNYNEPIDYYELSAKEQTNTINEIEKTNSSYIFDREITSHINNSYDLLNIVDYLLLKFKGLNFLMEVIKNQRTILKQINEQ